MFPLEVVAHSSITGIVGWGEGSAASSPGDIGSISISSSGLGRKSYGPSGCPRNVAGALAEAGGTSDSTPSCM